MRTNVSTRDAFAGESVASPVRSGLLTCEAALTSYLVRGGGTPRNGLKAENIEHVLIQLHTHGRDASRGSAPLLRRVSGRVWRVLPLCCRDAGGPVAPAVALPFRRGRCVHDCFVPLLTFNGRRCGLEGPITSDRPYD